jgi:hypothetical protein
MDNEDRRRVKLLQSHIETNSSGTNKRFLAIAGGKSIPIQDHHAIYACLVRALLPRDSRLGIISQIPDTSHIIS